MPENQFYQSYKQIPTLVRNNKCLLCKGEIVKMERIDNHYRTIELCKNQNCIRGNWDFMRKKNWKIQK